MLLLLDNLLEDKCLTLCYRDNILSIIIIGNCKCQTSNVVGLRVRYYSLCNLEVVLLRTIFISVTNRQHCRKLLEAIFMLPLLTLQVHIGIGSLYQEVTVENTGDSPLEFTTALHTYFRVSSIEKVIAASSHCHPET